jgi:hypothetical protein
VVNREFLDIAQNAISLIETLRSFHPSTELEFEADAELRVIGGFRAQNSSQPWRPGT